MASDQDRGSAAGAVERRRLIKEWRMHFEPVVMVVSGPTAVLSTAVALCVVFVLLFAVRGP